MQFDEPAKNNQNIMSYLQNSENRLNSLQSLERELKEASDNLAMYLCERSEKFSLIDCFRVISDFRKKFKEASAENKQREARQIR